MTGNDGNGAPREDVLIKTEDLWKTYVMGAEEVHALRGVSFEIMRGEYVAIMGPSGSGKSTMMNLIGCLDTPSKGSYYLTGRLVSDMNDDELAHIRNKEIGFVFQTFNLLARATALHNVELPLIYNGTPPLSAREGDQSAATVEPERTTSPTSRLAVALVTARALVNNPSIICDSTGTRL
jgi:putative ABC transport system ATP-binding protein